MGSTPSRSFCEASFSDPFDTEEEREIERQNSKSREKERKREEEGLSGDVAGDLLPLSTHGLLCCSSRVPTTLSSELRERNG